MDRHYGEPYTLRPSSQHPSSREIPSLQGPIPTVSSSSVPVHNKLTVALLARVRNARPRRVTESTVLGLGAKTGFIVCRIYMPGALSAGRGSMCVILTYIGGSINPVGPTSKILPSTAASDEIIARLRSRRSQWSTGRLSSVIDNDSPIPS